MALGRPVFCYWWRGGTQIAAQVAGNSDLVKVQEKTLKALIDRREAAFVQARTEQQRVQEARDAAADLCTQLSKLAPRLVANGQCLNAAVLRSNARFHGRLQQAAAMAKERQSQVEAKLNHAKTRALAKGRAMQALKSLSSRRQSRDHHAELAREQALSDQHSVIRHAR